MLRGCRRVVPSGSAGGGSRAARRSSARRPPRRCPDRCRAAVHPRRSPAARRLAVSALGEADLRRADVRAHRPNCPRRSGSSPRGRRGRSGWPVGCWAPAVVGGTAGYLVTRHIDRRRQVAADDLLEQMRSATVRRRVEAAPMGPWRHRLGTARDETVVIVITAAAVSLCRRGSEGFRGAGARLVDPGLRDCLGVCSDSSVVHVLIGCGVLVVPDAGLRVAKPLFTGADSEVRGHHRRGCAAVSG